MVCHTELVPQEPPVRPEALVIQPLVYGLGGLVEVEEGVPQHRLLHPMHMSPMIANQMQLGATLPLVHQLV